jgi:hypothetical protein
MVVLGVRSAIDLRAPLPEAHEGTQEGKAAEQREHTKETN